MSNCLFCRIAAGAIPAEVVLSDERVIAIRDIDPKAPTHVLVIPRTHFATLTELDDHELAGHLLACCRLVAEREGIASSGFRIVINTGQDGGQSVDHLHMHVLGGRPLAWPPG